MHGGLSVGVGPAIIDCHMRMVHVSLTNVVLFLL